MSLANMQALLGEAEKAGPREFPPTALADLQAAAANLGYPFAHLYLAQARDTEELHAALALALKLPEWYGHNWDALADCLCDLSWKPAPGYLIFVEGHDALRAAHPDDFDTLIEIFAEAADYWREEDVPFWTLLAPPADGTRFLPCLEA